MRAIAVCCLVAACGNAPGLVLVVKGNGPSVASVEVFLPDGVDDSSIGMPPQHSAPIDGAVFSVVDSVKATVSGDARILLQQGSIHDVEGLLVLAYDGNGTPVAEKVIRNMDGSPIHLPSTTTTELEITLDPATYVTPMAVTSTSGTRIARWSPTGAAGDLQGGCIAVLTAAGNSFFDSKADLDCDNKQPECNERVWDFVDVTSTMPAASACASRDFRMPDTGRACRLGQTIACTDGTGTCSSLVNVNLPPVCVPDALCKSCPNSDSTSGTSGIDVACELDAVMNGDDVPYVDCDLDAIMSTETMLPCSEGLPALDFRMHAGTGWGCTHASLIGFTDSFGRLGAMQPPGVLPFGASATTVGDTLTASCPSSGVPSIHFEMGSSTGQALAIPIMTTADAMLVFPVTSPSSTGAFAELAIPFHLHFHSVLGCAPTGPSTTETCTLKTLHGGDYSQDHMWSGCAGAM